MASRVRYVAPRPGASTRPSDPPTSTGLPVTAAGTEWPECIEIVSMIHAITWGLVPMSGAGMSFSGPIRMAISVA